MQVAMCWYGTVQQCALHASIFGIAPAEHRQVGVLFVLLNCDAVRIYSGVEVSLCIQRVALVLEEDGLPVRDVYTVGRAHRILLCLLVQLQFLLSLLAGRQVGELELSEVHLDTCSCVVLHFGRGWPQHWSTATLSENVRFAPMKNMACSAVHSRALICPRTLVFTVI